MEPSKIKLVDVLKKAALASNGKENSKKNRTRQKKTGNESDRNPL